MSWAVFIAHASPDKPTATELLKQLLGLGCVAVLDADYLNAGDTWDDALLAAQSASRLTVVLLSPNVKVGDRSAAYYLKEEIAHGISLTRGGLHRVVPVEIAPITVAPYGLNRVHRLRAYDAVGLSQVAAEIVALLAEPGERRARIIGSIPRVPEQFTGRESLLVRLEVTPDASIVTQTLAGLGGIGKTTVAAAYARSMTHVFDPIWWVRAETSDTLETDLEALAVRLGLGSESRTERARAAVDWLQRAGEPWLLVFDNAADRALLNGWIPTSGHGQVLVTTRNRNLISFGTTVDVGVLDPTTAESFLCDRVRARNEVAAEDATVADVAANLQGLPLALEQAAAWVARSPRRSWAAYLELYDRVDRDAFAPETVPDAYTATTSTTWKVSIDAATVESPLAPRLLDAIAFLAPEAIPLELFCFDGSDHDDYLTSERLDVEAALDALHGYALIDLTSGDASVHRVVQHVTRATAGVSALPFAARRIAALMPGDATHPDSWEACRRLESHVLAVADHAISLTPETAGPVVYSLDRIANFLQYSGSFTAAVPWFERSLADRLELLGDRHTDTLTARANLAGSYGLAGRVSEAIPLLERVLVARVQVSGDGHPDTMMARANLASLYSTAGRVPEAITLEERVLGDRVETLGDRHPETLRTRANLATSYWSAGRLAEAAMLREQVLADRVEVLGDRHPDTLTARSDLAGSYRSAGRADDAIKLDRQVLVDRVELLGIRHPDTLRARANLAHSYRLAGRLPEATALLGQVLADQVQVLGHRHPDTLTARANLAHAYRSAGRVAEAITLQERVLADRVEVLGDRHPDTLRVRANLATSYRSAGRMSDASTMLEAAIDGAESLDFEHPEAALWRAALTEWTAGD